jgi:hypothetical protein
MLLLSIVFLLLACYDAAHTYRMLKTHGLSIEMNPALPWLARKIGLAPGVWTGIMIPTLALVTLGLVIHPILEFLVPARGFLFGLQLRSAIAHG